MNGNFNVCPDWKFRTGQNPKARHHSHRTRRSTARGRLPFSLQFLTIRLPLLQNSINFSECAVELSSAIAVEKNGRRRLTPMTNPKRWARNRLYRGDLTLLADIARTQYIATTLDPSRLDRLIRRNFVKIKATKPVVTVRGRAALIIKKITLH
jgi:hypothetical protein